MSSGSHENSPAAPLADPSASWSARAGTPLGPSTTVGDDTDRVEATKAALRAKFAHILGRNEGADRREPREVCMRCRRPARVCWCAHVRTIDTETRVVLLQHPRERDMPIGTARMASLSLANSELHVGVKWSGSRELAEALGDPSRPAMLLYPGDGAIDVRTNPPKGPITLVVVDGTWWQAKKLIRANPELAALPRLAFTPDTASEYRIRKEPAFECVSTIEALVHVLSALEGDPARFQQMLVPFRAMIDTQIEHAESLHGARIRHKKGLRPAKRNAMTRLREHWRDLVCVMADANAWPYGTPNGERTAPDELVVWTAHRPATGESFRYVVAPAGEIAPNTCSQVGVSREELLAGGTTDELFARWNAFIRDSDVIVGWGLFATRLFTRTGGSLPGRRIDVRQVARDRVQGKVGSMDDVLASLGPSTSNGADEQRAPASLGPGRSGERLARLEAIVRAFVELPPSVHRRADDAEHDS